MTSYKYIKFFNQIGIKDIPVVGGKNASLGEMYQNLANKGIQIPNGIATTSDAYFYFLKESGLDSKIREKIKTLNFKDLHNLNVVSKEIRDLIIKTPFPKDLEEEISRAYLELSKSEKINNLVVAVRSSATAEDLPDASFAGQQDTYLNISGVNNVLISTKKCIASLFNERAIVYRKDNKYDHTDVALSVGIQQLVDAKSAGVIFTIDTESGFKDVVVVSSSWGLGENVVQGHISPDEFTVFKPTNAIIKRHLGSKEKKMVSFKKDVLKNIKTTEKERSSYSINEDQVVLLSKWAVSIEEHYKRPMDIEWALDKKTNKLFILQARPETVRSRDDTNVVEQYELLEKSETILNGTSVGSKIGAGKICKIDHVKDIEKFIPGSVLVTEMTDPDWVPIMKQASAIVTNTGGRTCHAAIISRELGIPCVVGTKNATKILKQGRDITVDCSNGDEGRVYNGILKFKVNITNIKNLKRPKTKIMMNVGHPELAFKYSMIPNDGVGLAREEFIIDSHIKIHPLALLHFDKIKDPTTKKQINELTKGYSDRSRYFVDKLTEGIAMIAAAFYPKDVIVRMSDFKSNEYANLIGGNIFEPTENNPMLGWRGASRYYSSEYEKAFELECEAFKRARNELGLTNIKAMIPFCRTLDEADKVIALMRKHGLKRGVNGFELYVMAEVPSNFILAEEFANRFDGFSIGSNDLTQLTLGVDRDNSNISHIYNENNQAVKDMISKLIKVAKKKKVKVGICGQGPSDFPEFAKFLVNEGIDSISLTPDTVISTTIQTKITEDKLKIKK
ncbi:MAG: phosphoenolpyruvate synthase [bacterium]